MLADTRENKPTKDQQSVMDSIDRSCAVVAGAGSGKTTALVGLCLNIVENDESNLDRILTITFTEKAAGELKKRLREKLPRFRHKIECAWIGTFHSCFARILRQSAPLIGLDPSFRILDENAARLLCIECAHEELLAMLERKNAAAIDLVSAVEFRTALEALNDLLSFRWHAKEALSKKVDCQDDERSIFDAMRSVFNDVSAALSARFARLGAIDFQELEILVLTLFDSHPEVLEQYRRRFGHILVDEFQDTNDLQTKFVLKLHDPLLNKLCIVGDPRQSIYRFRGANVECFAKALGVILESKGQKLELKENFRSAKDIVDFVNSAQVQLADGLFGSLTARGIGATAEAMIASAPGKGLKPALTNIKLSLPKKTQVGERRRAEGRAIANAVLKMTRDEGIAASDIAMLFRALTDTTPYELALKESQIPYTVFGGRGFLERQEISDITAVLFYAADQSDNAALLQILRSPLVGLSDDELLIMAGESGNDLRKNCAKDDRCALISKIAGLAVNLKPSEILRSAISMTGYEEICFRLDPSGGMNANLDRFITLASSIERAEPTTVSSFTNFIGELRRRNARMGDSPAAGEGTGAVKIMTIHAAKGLEFPVVILPDLIRAKKPSSQNHLFSRSEGLAFKMKDPFHPYSKRIETDRFKNVLAAESEADDAELKRLLYVAMTRAVARLVIPTHEDPSSSWIWMNQLIPIVDEFTANGSMEVSAESPDESKPKLITNDLDIRPSSVATRLKPMRPPHLITVSELECFSNCPREYHYKYVLQIPSSFTKSGDDSPKRVKTLTDRPPANVLGSIVHGILEKYSGDKSSFEGMTASTCLANKVLPSEWINCYVKSAVQNLEEHPLGKRLNEGRREVRFDWKVGNTIITGSIDWLLPEGEGFHIVDFKTDALPAGLIAKKAEEYELQMTCYALAAESATNKTVLSTSLMFLCAGETHSAAMTAMRRDASIKLIEESIQGIADGLSDRLASHHCERCPYRGRCKD